MKKMLKKLVAIVAVILIVSAVLTACGKTSLVGKWSNSVNGVEVISFTFTDDKMSISMAGITTVECDYTLEDGNIVCSIAGLETEIPYSIDGNKLTVKYMMTSYTLEKSN